MISLAATLITLVLLHGPEGQKYYVNPAEISSVREPIAHDLRQFSKGTRCIIVTTNGKFIAVHETCEEVRAAVSKVP